MKNQRRRVALEKRVPGESNSKVTHITDIPYDILIMILSLLPIKDVVATSSVCKDSMFLWCDVTQLNFDASEILYKISKNKFLYGSERYKYIKQVNSVLQSYSHPVVHKFRINFDLSYLNQTYVDKWLQLLVNKRVEILELDMENPEKVRDLASNYEFPLGLNNGPYSNARVVEPLPFKKLYLNNVRVRDAVFEELLTRCPHLESISIHGSRYLTRIRVSGRHLKLKHFEIKDCNDLQSLYLSNIHLVSFTYKGEPIDIRFSKIPTLKDASVCQQPVGFKKVNGGIFSFGSYMQTLSFTFCHPKKSGKLEFNIPQLPKVKKLTLIIGAHEDNCLLEVASIANKCQNLETFIIQLVWFSPNRRRRRVKHVAGNDRLGNLQLFKFFGYYGRISDLELVSYVMENAVALKKIVIDPRSLDACPTATKKELLKKENAARSSVEHHLTMITLMKPPGVKLVLYPDA